MEASIGSLRFAPIPENGIVDDFEIQLSDGPGIQMVDR